MDGVSKQESSDVEERLGLEEKVGRLSQIPIQPTWEAALQRCNRDFSVHRMRHQTALYQHEKE